MRGTRRFGVKATRRRNASRTSTARAGTSTTQTFCHPRSLISMSRTLAAQASPIMILQRLYDPSRALTARASSITKHARPRVPNVSRSDKHLQEVGEIMSRASTAQAGLFRASAARTDFLTRTRLFHERALGRTAVLSVNRSGKFFHVKQPRVQSRTSVARASHILLSRASIARTSFGQALHLCSNVATDSSRTLTAQASSLHTVIARACISRTSATQASFTMPGPPTRVTSSFEVVIVPNVSRSGKPVYSPQPTSLHLVPNVSRSGKRLHANEAPRRRNLCPERQPLGQVPHALKWKFRTSTTSRFAECTVRHERVPNVSRSGKLRTSTARAD